MVRSKVYPFSIEDFPTNFQSVRYWACYLECGKNTIKWCVLIKDHAPVFLHKLYWLVRLCNLQELPVQQRGDAVKSMVYEANARVRDPVYGCVGAISSLQHQIDVLQTQLALAQAEVVHMRMREFSSISIPPATNSPENDSPSPSSKLITPSSQTKSFFNIDMVVDHANMGDSLWSC